MKTRRFLLLLFFLVSSLMHIPAASPLVGCPAGSWMDHDVRARREQELRVFVRHERERLSGRLDPLTCPSPSCFNDPTRIYGYEHPDWPKLRNDRRAPCRHPQQRKTTADQTILPQIDSWSPENHNKTVYLHVLWKSGATSIKHGFRQSHRTRMRQKHPPPSSDPETSHAVLFARDPVRRFASGISEVYHRARHQGNLNKQNPPRWWRHIHRRFSTGFPNVTRLIEGMLLDVEHPSGCMGGPNPLHHLRSAGMFYSHARYPEHWLQSWTPTYQELCIVGEPPSQRSSSRDTTIPKLLREYGGNPAALMDPKNRRATTVKPSDVPHTNQIAAELYRHPKTLLRRVCRVYAADFICFGWTPPDACSDLF